MKRLLSILIIGAVFLFSIGSAQSKKKIKAPTFSLKTQKGEVVELAQLKGKVVLLNFWATWCGPCRKEIPDFIEVYNAYKSKGFEIVGIALDQEGWSKVAPFIKKAQINYLVVLGSLKVTQQYGGIESIPTTFLIDKKGYIIGRQIGVLPKEALEQALQSVFK